MSSKPYQISENEPVIAAEPAVAYETIAPEISSCNEWNPNVPFHGTQEEWWEHIHKIEEGTFETWEEHQKKFYSWKKQFLANRM